MTLVTRPTGLSFVDWASQIVLDLEYAGLLPQPHTAKSWQDWAAAASRVPEISKNNIPDPYLFSNWQEWAEQFVIGVD